MAKAIKDLSIVSAGVVLVNFIVKQCFLHLLDSLITLLSHHLLEHLDSWRPALCWPLLKRTTKGKATMGKRFTLRHVCVIMIIRRGEGLSLQSVPSSSSSAAAAALIPNPNPCSSAQEFPIRSEDCADYNYYHR